MTKIKMETGDVYTNLSPEEVRHYLQKGVKTGSIPGWEDAGRTVPILINIYKILYVYM